MDAHEGSWRLVSLRRCIYRHMATSKSKLTGRTTARPTHLSRMEVAVWGERDAAHNSSGKHSEGPKEAAITASGPD